MKLSLRNLALASTVMVAGAAFAQDVPTITKVWGTSISGTSKNDTRFGTGVNGKVYYNDKAAGKVMVIDAEGQKEYAAVEGLGTGITADDAGNLMVNTSFPNAASATNMVLINADGSQTPIVLSYPSEVTAARVDQIGRIVGDVFSEEGSFFYLGANAATSVAMFQLAEGKQITPLEYYASEALQAPALNTSSIVQPEFTFEELVDMGDDAINGFAARNRSSKSIYYFNPDGEFVAMPAPAGSNTQEGFDVFTLGDVMYQVMPIKGQSGANYSCEFVIADEEGNFIFTEEVAGAEDGSQNFGSFAARKVSDYKVELYMFYSSGKGIQAAEYEIALPEPEVPAEPKFTDRGQFVYNLNLAQAGSNVFTVTFESTGDAAYATLVLTDKATDESVYVDLKGDVKKGENTYSVDLNDYAKENGEFNYAIELHNYEIADDIVTEPVNIGGNRGGVVCMVDPAYPDSYGMTVVARSKNGGFDIYNQLGEKIKEAIHANNAVMGGTSANTSCPMRGRQRFNTAQFANWGDAAYGVVALDFKDLDKEPFSVFEGVKEKNGTVMNGDVAVGSGTPGMAYAGEGEGTILFTFDEDIFGNNLAGNPIGEALTTGKAAVNWGFKSAMANTVVGLCGTKTGLFFSQNRANGMETGVVGLGYIDITDGVDGADIIWRAADEEEQYPEFLKSATGGIDINPTGDLLAVSTYTGINIYLLSWDDNKPVLEPYKEIASPYQSGVYTTVRFDAGNNLHVINQTQGYYQVIMADKEPISVTAGKDAVSISTGVDNVAVDAEAAEAVYYNLNGVKVDADNLTPGVYVKVAGKVATKVVVK